MRVRSATTTYGAAMGVGSPAVATVAGRDGVASVSAAVAGGTRRRGGTSTAVGAVGGSTIGRLRSVGWLRGMRAI